MANNPTFKPSPLSFGSPRASPFRRPSTPNSPPSAGRTGTPGSSPSRSYTPMVSPSKLNQSYTVADRESASPKSEAPIPQPNFKRELPPSPTKGAQSPGASSPILRTRSAGYAGLASDAAAKLPAHQVREIREAFQVLDRDNDGLVNKDDVIDVLTTLGQDSSSSTVSRFFPPGSGQTINFPTFLNTLSGLMASMSPSQELLNALAAFDDDDNGQIDVGELRDALLHTAPEDGELRLTERQIDEVFSGFTGRRAFGRGAKSTGMGKRGEVFQYHDFVRNVMGGENGNNANSEGNPAQA
ncbi:Calcium-binding EF-hand [Penicillium antarcticum]|uniref:Calcium-binding EF-hand n=1 Tax=Penicillium antarcticum TaxID=416450 RepID=UPI00238453CE|nr:Calcium-binding EF-hand [Penicillium antarcticum]KAJ5308648.1 Calcium-binding EF-hand [Penicillium antarcticum]